MSLETRETELFWRDIPGFCRDIPGVAEKFVKKRLVFNSRPLVAPVLFSPHLSWEIAEANLRQCQWFSPRFSQEWTNHRIAKSGRFANFVRQPGFNVNSHRPLNGPFRGAVFRHGGGALKQPIKQPTETPTSTLASMDRFPSLMGRFPTLMGCFTDFVLRGRFTS